MTGTYSVLSFRGRGLIGNHRSQTRIPVSSVEDLKSGVRDGKTLSVRAGYKQRVGLGSELPGQG
jgi:hypothetical protein